MTNENIFAKRPEHYLYCYNETCALAEQCLRYQAAKHTTPKESVIQVVNAAASSGKCPYFKEMKIVRMAYGMRHIYDKVLANDIAALRKSIAEHFGNGSYYKRRNAKHPITPKEQEYILRQFGRFGYSEGVEFDEYRDEVEWG